MAEDQVAAGYDSYYTSENLTVPNFIDRRLDEIVATFEPYRNNNRILDLGFGAGSFLEAASRAHWQAFGVEVSHTAIDHVRDRGFEVFCGQLADAGYADGYFDVVIASEVLEHVAHPLALLESIARVLRPGGLLWATTPHGRGISARLLGLQWSIVWPPEHLQLFSRGSVKQLLNEAGFRRIKVATHGVNPYELFHELWSRTKKGSGADGAEAPDDFDRLETGYQLCESMSENAGRRLLKRFVNGLLNAGRIGDSLKVQAEK